MTVRYKFILELLSVETNSKKENRKGTKTYVRGRHEVKPSKMPEGVIIKDIEDHRNSFQRRKSRYNRKDNINRLYFLSELS